MLSNNIIDTVENIPGMFPTNSLFYNSPDYYFKQTKVRNRNITAADRLVPLICWLTDKPFSDDSAAMQFATQYLDESARIVDQQLERDGLTKARRLIIIKKILSQIRKIIPHALQHHIVTELPRAISTSFQANTINRCRVYSITSPYYQSYTTIDYLYPIFSYAISPLDFHNKISRQIFCKMATYIQMIDDIVDVHEDTIRRLSTPITVHMKARGAKETFLLVADALEDLQISTAGEMAGYFDVDTNHEFLEGWRSSTTTLSSLLREPRIYEKWEQCDGELKDIVPPIFCYTP